MRTHASLVFACLCITHIVSVPTCAQNAGGEKEQRPTFDAISIRQMEPYARSIASGSTSYVFARHLPCVYSDDKVICQLSLGELIEEAYQRKRYEVVGPQWLIEDLYVFQAILSEKTSKENARLMIQRALEDRFLLKLHFEKRVLPVYEIRPGPRGAHLLSVDPPDQRRSLVLDRRAGASVVRSAGRFSAVAMRLDQLGFWISDTAGLDRPVLNGTGLDKQYKIELHWDPIDNADSKSDLRDQGILVALKVQAGLVLKQAQRPVDVLVIDSVSRNPTSNQ